MVGQRRATARQPARQPDDAEAPAANQAPDPQQVAPQAPQIRPRLLSLSKTNPYTGLSDITTEQGRRLWRNATEPLEEKFDGTHQMYQVFVANITNRFKMCNWFRFITFTLEGHDRNLISNPGLIPISDVNAARTGRMLLLDNPPDPDQAPIDDLETFNLAVITELHATMMYHFLVNSITTPLKTHISQKIIAGLVNEDGPTLLKYIQEKVRGRANKQAVLNARGALQSLNLKEFKFNLKKLHDHVNEQVLTISGNGSEVHSDGITAALLKAYKACNNEEFLHHIRHIEALADDQDQDIQYEDLMVKAETKYDVLVQSKDWNKKDFRDEQILALQAEVKSLKANKSRNGQSGKNGRSSGKGKPQYEDWRKVPPTNNKKHIQKDIKGKKTDFWWCEHHKLWARHKPEDCRAKNRASGDQSRPAGNPGSSGTNNNPPAASGSNTGNGGSSGAPAGGTPRLQASTAFVIQDEDTE